MRLTILLMMILCSLPGFSQPLREVAKGYTTSSSDSESGSLGGHDGSICLTPEQWDALEDQIWAETQKTVEEAVTAAVEPFKLYIKKQDCTILTLRISLGVAVGVAGVAIIWAALK